MGKIIRHLEDPTIDDKRINHQDHFELAYLRHKYFRKSPNPAPGRLEQFEDVICKISDKIYFSHITLFGVTGFERDDVRNIGRIHAISFIAMCGLKENPDLMDKFIQDHKDKYGAESEPGEQDIFLRECYNISKFLKQRFIDVVRVCVQKSSNIIGAKGLKKFFIGDPSQKPTDDELILNPEAYGFVEITQYEFRKLEKENKLNNKKIFINSTDGRIVRSVTRAVDADECISVWSRIQDNYYDGYFHKTPEEQAIFKEQIENSFFRK